MLDRSAHNGRMTDVERWSVAADASRRLGRAVEYHASLPSSNDRARAALADGRAGEGLAVVADEQTAGRGRQGRTWLTPASLNLAVSVAFRPRLAIERSGLLGIATAIAVRDACAASAPEADLLIRWPNDVLSAEGLKIAGVLVETSIVQGGMADAVIGMGINVNWRAAQMPADLQGRATSLADLAGRDLDRVELLGRLLARLDAEVVALERGASPVDRFRDVSFLTGKRVTVDLGESRVEGDVLGIDDDGSLRLSANGEPRSLTAGEVVSVRDAEPAEVTS